MIQYAASLDKIMVSQKPPVYAGMLGELQKVTWPTRQETLKLTVVVVVASVFVGLYIGSLDFIFAQLLRIFTTR